MEQHPEIMYKLGGIESLIKSNNEKLDTFIKETKDRHELIEKRVDELEKQSVRMWTVGSTLAAVISFIVGIALKVWPS